VRRQENEKLGGFNRRRRPLGSLSPVQQTKLQLLIPFQFFGLSMFGFEGAAKQLNTLCYKKLKNALLLLV